jgi:HAD superfamily hydrolase (TIGR01549 family)
VFGEWIDYWIIKRSSSFDPAYYLFTYSDCRRADVDPLLHFVKFGWKERRNPSPNFDTSYYLNANPDVLQSGINPLIHYIRYGRKEGRLPSPDHSPAALPMGRRGRGIRSLLTSVARSLYLRIPLKYRHRILFWSYRHFGWLFAGLPHYQMWKNGQAGGQAASGQSRHNLIDIRQVEPAQFAKGSIAVHLHIFYRDLAGEFVTYLRNMPFHYDLYVSISEGENKEAYRSLFNDLERCDSVTIRTAPNRGRDSAPLVCAFGRELASHAFIAHLHSKKSIYNKGATEGWREYLCNNLMGSEERIRRIFSLLQGDPPCGVVYPQNYAYLPYWANTWLANRGLAQAWCPRLGIREIPRGYFDYPASSMFWARSDALAPLFDAGISVEDFPEEAGQNDGTLAHFLERSFVLCSLSRGLPAGIIQDEAMPSWSPWRFDQYLNRTRQDVLQQLNSPNVRLIGFDIFDTLLCRPLLDPESIKMIVSRRIGEADGTLYRQYRAMAEQQARAEKGSDVGMEEIYASLGRLAGFSIGRLQEIRRIEEETEMASLEPRREAVELYQEALATGKPVALISDMFLPRLLIETVLRKYGIDGWDAMFLSSEVGLRKDSGQLYDHILAHYGISPGDMLMVGDNERSDVQIPCDMGAGFLHLFKPVELARGLPRFTSLIEKQERRPDLDAEICLGLVIRRNFSPVHFPLPDLESLVKAEPYNWGYSLVGPLLVGFSQWLLENARRDGIHRFYFLSREGKIMKEIYDLWSQGERDSPTSEYLVASRRAVAVAAITSLADILDISRTHYFPNPAEKFLFTRYGISLSESRWEELERSYGIDMASGVVVRDGMIDHLRPFLQALQPEILENTEKEKAPLLRYFAGKGLDAEGGQAVVDIGYGGTVQGHINKLLSRKVHGYYLMTDDRSVKIADLYQVAIRGCLIENARQKFDDTVVTRNSFNLEKLLSADEPQVERFELDSDGKASGVFRKLTLPEANCAGIKQKILEGARDYAGEARKIRRTMLPDFRPSNWTTLALLDAFFSRLSDAEQALLSKIVLDDYYCGRDLVT